MKKIIFPGILLFIMTLISCKQPKYEMHNMMPMMVDVSDYINSGEFQPDSCKRKLNRLKRTTPKVLDESYETLLQIKFKKWKDNYNRWLKQNNRDSIYFSLEFLYKKTKYQYSYIITDKPVDVYRTDTPLKINDIENMRFYIQLDENGELVSDFSENNYVDTSCDTINSEFQDVYSIEMEESKLSEKEEAFDSSVIKNWNFFTQNDFELRYPKNWKQENDFIMYEQNALAYWVFDSPKTHKKIAASVEYNKKNHTDAAGEGFYNDLLISKFKTLEEFKKEFSLQGSSLNQASTQNNSKFSNVKMINLGGEKAYEVLWDWTYGTMYAIIAEHNGQIYFLSFGSNTESPKNSSIEKNIINSFKFKNKSV